MKFNKLPILLIAFMAALVGSQVSLAEDAPQSSLVINEVNPFWNNSSDLYIGNPPSYEQIQESQVVCRYIPNLWNYSGDSGETLTLDTFVITPGAGQKKIILITDVPSDYDYFLKDFGYHFNENEAITVIHPLVCPNPAWESEYYPEEELRWDLNHFSCLKPYIDQDIETTISGMGKYAFAYVTFTVDESKLNATGSLHFEAYVGEDEHAVDIVVPIQIEAEQSK